METKKKKSAATSKAKATKTSPEIVQEEVKVDSKVGQKNYTALIALIILVLIVAIGFRGYYFYKQMKVSNPVKITTNYIKKMANSSKKSSNVVEKFFGEKKPYILSLSGNVSDLNFNFEGGVDLKNKIVTLLANVGGIGDLNVDGTIKSDNLLFKVSKDGNSYKLSQDFTEVFSYLEDYYKNLQDDSSDKVGKYLADSFEKAFSKKDFEKSKKDITLNGKEVTATVYETKVTKEKLTTMFNTLIDKLIKDEDFINSVLETISSVDKGATKEDVIDLLNNAKSDIGDIFEDANFTYSVVVYKAEAVGFGLANKDFKISYYDYKNQSSYNFTIEDINASIVDNNKEFSIKISAKEAPVELKYDKKDNSYSVKVQNMPIVSGTYKTIENDNSVEVDLTFNSLMLGINGTLTSKLELVDSLKEKSYENALDLNQVENMNKLWEELGDNELLSGLEEIFDNLLDNGDIWDSIDGIDL